MRLKELTCLSQLVAQSDLLEKLKPREVQNDFSKAGLDKMGEFQLQNARFKTRVRRNNQVVMTDRNNRQFRGIATHSRGKTTTIAIRKGGAPGGNLRTVKVVGLPEPTNSERARDELIYLVLAGQKSLQKSLFIQRLWFPDTVGQSTTVNSQQLENIVSPMDLNKSQHAAMCAMVGKSPIVIVHGTFDAIFCPSRIFTWP